MIKGEYVVIGSFIVLHDENQATATLNRWKITSDSNIKIEIIKGKLTFNEAVRQATELNYGG